MKAPGWMLLGVGVAASTVLGGCADAGSGARATAGAADQLLIVTAIPGTPGAAPTAVARRYVVAEGDTLSGIASAFGVTEQALQLANGIDDPHRLVVGQEIIVPHEGS